MKFIEELFDLCGKVVVIIGGVCGIGVEMVCMLVVVGVSVVIFDVLL